MTITTQVPAVPFDPSFDEVVETDGSKAIKVTIQTAEPTVLVAQGMKPSGQAQQAGYRVAYIPQTGDIRVYGDVVRVEGALSLPSWTVQINARVFEFGPDAAGKQASIDVSGVTPDPPWQPQPDQAGQAASGGNLSRTYHYVVSDDITMPTNGTSGQPGETGAPGAIGGTGGWIDIRCHDVRAVVDGATLAVNANGASGGPGQQGADGQPGGNGGNGGDAEQETQYDVWDSVAGMNAGRGGDGGWGGPGGPGGSAGSINVECVSELSVAASISTSSQAGKTGAHGAQGNPGKDGTPGKGGAGTTISLGGGYDSPGATEDYPGSPDGGYQDAIAHPADVDPTYPTLADNTPSVAGNCPFADLALTASAAQLAMVVDQARLQGLVLDRTNAAAVSEYGDRLIWLRGVAAAYPTSQPDASRVAPLTVWVNGALVRLSNPALDSFGNSFDWVPLASLAAYDSLLVDADSGSMPLLKDAEDGWAAYRNLRDMANATSDEVDTANSLVSARVNAIDKDRATVLDQLSSLSADILAEAAPIDAAKTAVTNDLDQFVQTVEHHFQATFGDFLNVIEQTAFGAMGGGGEGSAEAGDAEAAEAAEIPIMAAAAMPASPGTTDAEGGARDSKAGSPSDPLGEGGSEGKGEGKGEGGSEGEGDETGKGGSSPVPFLIGGSEIAKFLYNGFTTIDDNDGKSVERSYLINQIHVYGDSVKNLDEAYQLVAGQIESDDPNANKLLCTQDSLDDLLSNYTCLDGATAAKQAMDDYVDLVLARNAKILQYNAAAAQLAQLDADKAALQAEQEALGAEAASIDTPVLDRFYERLYQHAKDACISDLYGATRAYRFWSLTNSNVFTDVFGGKGPTEISYGSVADARSRIVTAYGTKVNASVADLGPLKDPIVLEFDTEQHPQIVKELAHDRGKAADGSVAARYFDFKVPTATDKSHSGQTPFAGKANVRLEEVRCWLIGLESAVDSTGCITVHLTHQGTEDIVAASGKVMAMEHDASERTFQYRASGVPEPAAVEKSAVYWPTDENIGTGGVISLPDLTPLGPFATWRVSVRPQESVGTVKWDELTKVLVQFYIRYQGFDT